MTPRPVSYTHLDVYKRQRLDGQLAQDGAAGEAARARVAQLAADSAALEAQLALLSGTDDDFLATRTRLTEELGELKLRRLAGEKDIESHRAAMESLAGRTGESDARAKQLAGNIAALNAQNEDSRQKIAAIEAAIESSRAEIAAREEAIGETSRKRMEKEGSINQQRQRQRQLTDEREAVSYTHLDGYKRQITYIEAIYK